jgi:heme/copper-type cytochrome/quinol oxidase subunit 2
MNKAGIYYGQCSELCGKGHGFMPIVVDSQHYSNNPFSNEILSGQNNPEGILPTASAEAGKG